MKDPGDEHLERSILSCIDKVGQKALDFACSIITDDMAFYYGHNRSIFWLLKRMAETEPIGPESCIQLSTLAKATDIVEFLGGHPDDKSDSVFDYIGGYAGILDVVSVYPDASRFKKNVYKLWSLFEERTLENELKKSVTLLSRVDSKPSLIIDGLWDQRLNLTVDTDETTVEDIHIDETERIKYQTGISGLDEAGIIMSGRCSVWAAKPGGGKTTFAVQALTHLANSGIKVGFVSLEMRTDDLAEKFRRQGLSLCRNVVLWRGVVDYAKLAYRVKAQVASGCKVICVDYIQKVQGVHPGERMYEYISKASGGLADIAKTENVAIVILAQYTKESRKQGHGKAGDIELDKEPQASDLAKSGDIEADADYIVMLWHRSHENAPVADLVWKVAKNRFGPTPQVAGIFDKPAQKFFELGQERKQNSVIDLPPSWEEDLFT